MTPSVIAWITVVVLHAVMAYLLWFFIGRLTARWIRGEFDALEPNDSFLWKIITLELAFVGLMWTFGPRPWFLQLTS